jgi:hypothetical protein
MDDFINQWINLGEVEKVTQGEHRADQRFLIEDWWDFA